MPDALDESSFTLHLDHFRSTDVAEDVNTRSVATISEKIRQHLRSVLRGPSIGRSPELMWKDIANKILISPLQTMFLEVENEFSNLAKELIHNPNTIVQACLSCAQSIQGHFQSAIELIRSLITEIHNPADDLTIRPHINIEREFIPQFLIAHDVLDRIVTFEKYLQTILYAVQFSTEHDSRLPSQGCILTTRFLQHCLYQSIQESERKDNLCALFTVLKQECFVSRLAIEQAGQSQDVWRPSESLPIVLQNIANNVVVEARKVVPNFSAIVTSSIPPQCMHLRVVSPSVLDHLVHLTAIRLLLVAHHSGLSLGNSSRVDVQVLPNQQQTDEYIVRILVESTVVTHAHQSHVFEPSFPLLDQDRTGPILQHITSKPMIGYSQTQIQNFQSNRTTLSADIILPLPPENSLSQNESS